MRRNTGNGPDSFVYLGAFEFAADKPAVVVSNAGADGYVVIDAVQWLPVKGEAKPK